MTMTIQPVLGDLGSQEVQQLIVSYNALLDTLDVLITGMSTAVNTAAVNALAVTALASLEANSFKLRSEPQVPVYRTRATV